MKKAYLMDLTVVWDYILRITPICLLIGCLMTYAMESLIPVVGLLMCMFAMMGVISLAMYDEQGEWRRYRLALPVLRRSVVLARYGVALTLMLAGLALALGLDVILWLLGMVVLGLSAYTTVTPDVVMGTLMSGAIGAIGSTFVIAFVVPMAFKWESVRAVSLIPLVLVLVVGLAKHMADQLLSEHMQLFISSLRLWIM